MVDETVSSRLGQWAALQPGAAALNWPGGAWSYAQLQERSAEVARLLRECAVPPGARVALLFRNSAQYVAAYFGALEACCTVVPLNVQDRGGVLATQMSHCAASALLGDPQLAEWASLLEVASSRGAAVIAWPTIPNAQPQALVAARAQDPGIADSGSAAASIIYTSGTTGRPKGVALGQRNIASNAATIAAYLRLDTADRGLCVLPFHFSYGNSVLQSHLWAGACVHIEDNLAYPHVTLRRMQDEAITGFAGVPSTFALLLERAKLADFDLSTLRYLTQAGGAMSRRLISRLARELPGVAIFVMYGQTEATARLTYLEPASLEGRLGSVGKPIDGVEIEVRKEDGHIAAPGETGEICARGPNVMLGYWNDPAATSEVLRDGWLHTGDLGHVDADGFLYIDGRAVEMIKVGAFRVSPLEVEEMVAALDEVLEVAAVGVEDPLLGQAIKVVVVPRPGASLETMAVKSWCRQHLATYKVPKYVEFVAALPRTSSGKVQKFKLS